MLAMDLNEFPKTVSCIGGNLCDTDKGPDKDGKPNGERREVADTQLVLVEFPSGVMFFLASTTSNERGVDDVIRGQKANLTLGGNKLVLEPERPFSDEIERKDEAPEEPETNHANHVRNFLEAMRGNGVLNCPIDLGLQVQTVVSMAEKAYREKTQVRFDPQRRKMTS
jgi:hypothetical protein